MVKDAKQGAGQGTDQKFRSAIRATGANMYLVSTAAGADVVQSVILSSAVPLVSSTPAILLALPLDREITETVVKTGSFCLGILSHGHAAMAGDPTITHNPDDPSNGLDWTLNQSGIPYLTSALASIFCRVTTNFQRNDHEIVLAETSDVLRDPTDDRLPLVWLHGMPLEPRD